VRGSIGKATISGRIVCRRAIRIPPLMSRDHTQGWVREAWNCECALPNYIQKVSMGILKGFSRIAAHSPLSIQESNSIIGRRFSSSSFSE
jgi:hypothetical protein